jgi:hypothetical protein
MASPFHKLVKAELVKVRNMNNKIKSYHEGWAILFEEVDELWEEVRKKSTNRDKKNALLECVQIAAVAQRMAEDLVLIDGEDVSKSD